ncbi:MAG: PD-(D/E)XK nuclease family protein [Chthoniobacterales bacterium]
MPSVSRFTITQPAQIAERLLDGRGGTPPDLGDTLVIVPTAGAGRIIRRELVRRSAGGVLSPQFASPLDAVQPTDAGDLATESEREAAWMAVLRATNRRLYEGLIPSVVKFDSPDDVLGAAGRLVDVCDLLAEAGLHPGSPEVAEVCAHDAQRWAIFGRLHQAYLEVLERSGLRDPNEARSATAAAPERPEGRGRIVVACVPDLPVVTERYLNSMLAQGVAVEIFSWRPSDAEARMDAWGRPEPEWWATHLLAVPDQCVVAAHDTMTEADALLRFAAGAEAGTYAIVSAAPEATIALEAELIRRGSVPYSPEGRSLAGTEAATILLGWEDFLRTGRLRGLRSLLGLPAFLRLLTAAAPGLTAESASEACDRLVAERLCETLASALDWRSVAEVPKRSAEKRSFGLMTQFLEALNLLLSRNLRGRELLAAVYADQANDDPGQAAELSCLAGVLEAMEASALLSGLDATATDSVLRREMARRRVFAPAPDGVVEILGWLEAAWADGPTLGLSGCREGALPSGVAEDVFLPDGVRARLRLSSQASRFARDAYLLSSLLAARGPEHVRLGTSRFRPGGEPNRPSRLLLGCADDDLPARVEKMFHPPSPLRRIPAPPDGWKLRLPAPLPVTSLSVTQFKHYLTCPLRFYLGQICGWESFDAEATEINAANFGTLMHRVLENFARGRASDATDEGIIADFLSEELDREVARQHGRQPSPVVRVQVESMRARLRRFAVLQAGQRRDGWRIIEAEYAVGREAGAMVGSLALAGTMDRVEVHEELGLRVLDYKTFGRAQTPEETHFGSVRAWPDFPEAMIARPAKREKMAEKHWTDLQLPLYRQMASALWPDHAAKGVAAGYILLPGDAEDTRVALLELDDTAFQSAMACAAAVADRVARGVFWPPTPGAEVRYDDFEAWFDGKNPALVLEEETIASLKGRP